MRIVLDTSILVRASGAKRGLARDVLLQIIESPHVLVLSEEILFEVSKVLRYPRMVALLGLTEERIYDYIGFLREVAEVVALSPEFTAPVRDANDIIVIQTAVVGEANVLCTRDRDLFEDPAGDYLMSIGVTVLDDIALMRRLRE